MSRLCGKVLPLFLILIFTNISNLHAESDSGKFFPSAADFDISNFYLEAYGGLAFPLSFTSQDFVPMTDNGWDIAAGFGFNWGGWLFGFDYNRSMYGQGTASGALMENFVNNLFEFRLRRVISKASISKLPSWLEIIPGLALGVDFITTDYYTSTRAKADGRLTSVGFAQDGARCFFGKVTFENAFYLGTDYFIPFIEGDFNLFYDNSIGGGLAMFFTANIGIRTYPGSAFHKNRSQKFRKEKPAEMQEKALPETLSSDFVSTDSPLPVELKIQSNIHENFTPDGDGLNDLAILTPELTNICEPPQSWKLEILDPKGATFREYSGSGMPPQTLSWDGKGNGGEDVFAMNTYGIRLTVVPSAADVTRTGQTVIVAQDSVKTGIPLQVIIPDKKWKIVVNTIHFDPDKASFNQISEEQRRENIETLDSIANQIKEHPDCLITIEGYANNVTNTERENINELVPLSQLRAQAIMGLLSERGITKDILIAKGKGGANPLAAWEDRSNWWKNRRVEFIVEKQE
ncbi:OmpA family protein [Treponema sp. C6A8]|uniref:OmpA family protein n=1 Tax=Treponema sp. C6A8 TaxID=1410609 RepID=UPI0004870A4B|nr:OmpA family protein [Treponema sp. C6A8]